MNETVTPTSEKSCPMCGAALHEYATKCPACGEEVIAATSDGQAAESLANQELAAFVGRQAPYYLAKWRRVLDGSGAGTGFNLAAFLVSGLWLPFRKMYRYTLIFYSVVFAESVLEQIVWVGVLGRDEVPTIIDHAGSLIAAVVCGTYGNRWYLSYAQREIAKVRAEGLPQEEHLQVLTKRGGANFAIAIGLFALFVMANLAFFVLWELVLGTE
jgi:hypothetical protein